MVRPGAGVGAILTFRRAVCTSGARRPEPTKIKTEDDPLAPLENVLYQEENEDYDNEEKIYFDEIEAKTEQPDFKCEVCSECFENGQLLLEHVDSLHKKSIDHQHQKIYYHGGLQLFDCDICKEPFRSKGKLAKHK